MMTIPLLYRRFIIIILYSKIYKILFNIIFIVNMLFSRKLDAMMLFIKTS